MRRFSPALSLWRGLGRIAPGLAEGLALRAHRRQAGPAARAAERCGRASLPRPPGRLIWFHAASVGEVAGIGAIARDLAAETGAVLLVTTFTATGAEAARQALPAALHQFLPADSARAARGFLDHWRPDLAVFTESDLWPGLVTATAARGIPVALVNARPSRTRAAWPRLSGAVLSRMAVITAQSRAVAESLAALGLDPARIHVTGDVKAAAPPLPHDPALLAEMRARLGARPLWVAASTHPGDEGPVLAAHALARAAHPGLLLIVLPRHPARGGPLAATTGAPRRSAGQWPGADDAVWVADTLGETGLFYRLSPLVFLGGSFGSEGGHNPFEPARLGAAVLSGPGVAHLAEPYAMLAAAGAARIVQDGADLGRAVSALTGGEGLAAMQSAARAAMADGDAARARPVALLRGLL